LSFGLLQALRSHFSQTELPLLQELFLANLSNSPEQVGGLAVNPKGSVLNWSSVATAAVSLPTGGVIAVSGQKNGEVAADKIRISGLSNSVDPHDVVVTLNDQKLDWKNQ